MSNSDKSPRVARHIVNGREYQSTTLYGKNILYTYREIVARAGKNPDQAWTVAWGTADRGGTLTKGKSISLPWNEFVIFNVTNTGNS